MSLTPGKLERMQALSDERGVIAAAAMDQRGSLHKALTAAGGREATQEDMEEFKALVTEILTRHASAILLDPQYGLPAARRRAPGSGLLLAYEESGYDNTKPGRLPDLLPHESVLRIKQQDGDAVKILIYYTPFDDPEVNDIKHAFIERIGDECHSQEVPFFLEFIGYDPQGSDEKGLEFAKRKPEIVIGSMEEFSKPQYKVDILKVEVPINMQYVEGTQAFSGVHAAYNRAQAKELFLRAADAAKKPFIYLSAGVSNAVFTETLELATEAGVRYSGVLCGRATWQEGIPVFAQHGPAAFREWLETDGVRNINAVNDCLRSAKSWYGFYGADSPEALAAEKTGVGV
jgi:tagatose 1,6-diphosphate aldolase